MSLRQINFHRKNKYMIEKICEILGEYDSQGLRVTLRQLYYQLVARELIPNKQASYQKISVLLTNARYAGLIEWDAIEDRIRVPKIPTTFSNPRELIENAIYWYQKDRWNGQEYYVELWTEKDALSSVITPLTKKYQVPLCINRGYSSATAMYDAAQRFLGHDRKNVILYLGDHDPSGLDMDRDIRERLREFGANVKVIRIGLTSEQIKHYAPPPNPAKFKDPRAKRYLEKFGKTSWEVDALRPEILQGLVETSILEWLDLEAYKEIVAEEETEKEELRR